jgi:hypothetical protein
MPLPARQKAIVDDALIYGAVSTAASVPVMLWLVPETERKEWPLWVVPVALTVVSLLTKLVVRWYLHSEPAEEPVPALSYGRY